MDKFLEDSQRWFSGRGRDMRLHEFDDWDSLVRERPGFPTPFVCLLACNAEGLGVRAIAEVMKMLVDGGCRFIACWGPDCERVHDIAEEVVVELEVGTECAPFVPTTWHDGDPLEEALWEAMFAARVPDDEEGISPVLGICERRDDWPETIRRAFDDPERFCDRIVHGED